MQKNLFLSENILKRIYSTKTVCTVQSPVSDCREMHDKIPNDNFFFSNNFKCVLIKKYFLTFDLAKIKIGG